jgi:tellurite resistance-related uncharacterized protein
VRRRISGFHQDDQGDWVADLECLHRQHVRHRPPFQDRPWVTTEAGRAERVGAELECPLCTRAELPDGLVVTRMLGPFDEDSIPAGLRRAHRVPAGSWGLLTVLAGSAGFAMAVDPLIERELHGGDLQAIPPGVDHEVRLHGPVRLQVELLTAP